MVTDALCGVPWLSQTCTMARKPQLLGIGASETSSSSAAIIATEVRRSWPSSTLPVKTVTVSSSLSRIHASRSGARSSGEGSGSVRRSGSASSRCS